MSSLPVSETTPLLHPLPSNNNDESRFPALTTAAELLPPEAGVFDFENAYPHSLNSSEPLRALAFRLVLILHLYIAESSVTPRIGNTIQAFQKLNQRDRRIVHLRRIASEILESIPQTITDAELLETSESISKDYSLEYVLLASFTLSPLSSRELRAIDLLAHPDAPLNILSSRIITLSLVRLWKFGQCPQAVLPSEPSLVDNFLRVYDASSTPRAVHAVHFFMNLAYLYVLSHLTVWPTLNPYPYIIYGSMYTREIIVSLYSILNIAFKPISRSSFPHLLVLFSLLIQCPVHFTATAYALLPIAVCLHILAMSFPNNPSLLLFFEPSRHLPRSSLYAACIRRCLLPAFLFMIPLFFFTTILLSISISGPFLTIDSFISPSPSPARATFMLFFFLGILVYLQFSASIFLFSSTKDRENEENRGSDWERYGAAFGVEARHYLVQAIVAYTPSRNPFNLAYPPPLNILSGVLSLSPLFPGSVYKSLWRLIMGPLCFVMSGLWCWGRW